MAKKAGGHFQLACQLAFEGLHQGASADTGVNHPSQYYLESRRVYDEREGVVAAPAGGATTGDAPAGGGAAAGGCGGCDGGVQRSPLAAAAAGGSTPPAGAAAWTPR
ncbi:hypothetical protein FOA52_012327 [Chlamydomonas sp. UWO 241]|nr:hypothetical protein FOA52_012327 [Chlamydomonas sp. UWO 241]